MERGLSNGWQRELSNGSWRGLKYWLVETGLSNGW